MAPLAGVALACARLRFGRHRSVAPADRL